MNLLLGPVEEGLVISQIGHDVPGEVVLDYGEIRNHWVDLLRSCLSGHYSEFVLLFCHWPAVPGESVGLRSDVKSGDFPATGLVGESLAPLELLFEAILVEVLKFLQSLSNAIRLSCNSWLFHRFYLLWFLMTSRIGQIVKMFIVRLNIPLHLHFLLDNFFEILKMMLRLLF